MRTIHGVSTSSVSLPRVTQGHLRTVRGTDYDPEHRGPYIPTYLYAALPRDRAQVKASSMPAETVAHARGYGNGDGPS